MPFYPALPEYKPALSPLSGFEGGLMAGTQLMAQRAKTGYQQELLTRARGEREALQKVASGAEGGWEALLAAAPDMYMKLGDYERRVADSVLDYSQKAAPYIKTKEDYDAFYKDVHARYKKVPPVFPHPDKVQSDAEAIDIMRRPVAFATATEKSRMEMKAGVELQFQKDLDKEVKDPARQQEFRFKKELVGMEYDNRVSLQENARSWDFAFHRMNDKLQRDIHGATDQRTREKTIIDALTHRQTAVDRVYAKGLEDIEKLYGPGPERNEAVANLERQITQLYDRQVESIRPYADEFGVKLPPTLEKPTFDTRKGPARGVDRNFDDTMDQINRMNITEAEKEAKRKRMVEIYNERKGTTHPSSVPLTSAPAPTTTANVTVPAPPAPTPAPKPAPKPAPTPAPAPAPTQAAPPPPPPAAPPPPTTAPTGERPGYRGGVPTAEVLPERRWLGETGRGIPEGFGRGGGPGLPTMGGAFLQKWGTPNIPALGGPWQGPGTYQLPDGRTIYVRDEVEYRRLIGG